MLTEIAISSDYGERIHTPTVVDAVLPLPELMPREEPSPEDASFRGGGVANINGHTILWRATNRELTLELANLNGPQHGAHVLSFVAPGAILSNATTFSEGPNGNFVVDFFLKSGFLYTIDLPFSCFDDWVPPTTWRTVKCPFGVDVVKAVSLRSRGALELIASLEDGTTARLLRSKTLAELEINILPDPTEPGLLNRVFFRQNDMVPTHPGLSTRAAVDLCSFNDYIIALCVNGNLRVWSTATNTCVKEIKPTSTEAHPLITTPSCYMKVQHGHLYICSKNQFSIYNQNFEPIDSRPLPAFSNDTHIVDFTCRPDTSIIAAFRSPRVSQIWCFEPKESYPVSTTKPVISQLPDARELQRFVDNIFSVKSYSSSTLRKALARYTNTSESDVANLTVSAPISSALSLRDAVTNSVKKQASLRKTEESTQWNDFNGLCKEYENQVNEVWALGPSADGLIWSVRAAYYTLLAPVSKIQRTLAQDKAAPNSDSVLDAINELWDSVPPSSLFAFEADLKRSIIGFSVWGSDLISSTSARLYDSYISPHIDDAGILKIRAYLVKVKELSAQLKTILNECIVKDPTVDGTSDTLTPLGCAALSTIAIDHAESSLKFVSKVIFFTLFAAGEGLARDHHGIYITGISHLRTSWAILSLREPLESYIGPFNAQTTALEISVSQLNLRVHDFDSLVSRLWHKLDFTDAQNLGLVINLIKQHWNGNALMNATQFLLDDPESQFLKGLAKLSIPEQQDTGENIIRALAPQLSQSAPHLGELLGFGNSVSRFFYAIATLCREIGIPGQCTLGFIKLASRYDTQDIDVCALYLELALNENSYVQAYEAICGLSKRGDPNIRDNLEKFLDTAISQRTMEYVCKELVFPGLVGLVPEIFAARTTIGGLPTYKLLYMWCISRRNYLGAAKAIYNHIHGDGKADGNFLDLYTIALNALKLVKEESRWFVVNKRIVTEADIQLEYQNIYPKD